VARSAERELQTLPAEIHQRVAASLLRLEANPRPRGARKLAHGPGWRFRVGDYRVLFTVDDEARGVTVYAIGHRPDICRR
jgi:mRNA interferase RelE/StbE